MHGVLQPLHQLLQLLDASLERTKLILLGSDGGSLSGILRGRDRTPNLADPRNQTLSFAHGHRLPGRLA